MLGFHVANGKTFGHVAKKCSTSVEVTQTAMENAHLYGVVSFNFKQTK